MTSVIEFGPYKFVVKSYMAIWTCILKSKGEKETSEFKILCVRTVIVSSCYNNLLAIIKPPKLHIILPEICLLYVCLPDVSFWYINNVLVTALHVPNAVTCQIYLLIKEERETAVTMYKLLTDCNGEIYFVWPELENIVFGMSPLSCLVEWIESYLTRPSICIPQRWLAIISLNKNK